MLCSSYARCIIVNFKGSSLTQLFESIFLISFFFIMRWQGKASRYKVLSYKGSEGGAIRKILTKRNTEKQYSQINNHTFSSFFFKRSKLSRTTLYQLHYQFQNGNYKFQNCQLMSITFRSPKKYMVTKHMNHSQGGLIRGTMWDV